MDKNHNMAPDHEQEDIDLAMKNSLQENIDMSYLNDYAQANSSLDEMNKTMEIVPRDGNCLFYSLSDQIFGHQLYYQQLRAQAVGIMLENHRYFIGSDWEGSHEERSYQRFLKYAQTVMQPNAWGS